MRAAWALLLAESLAWGALPPAIPLQAQEAAVRAIPVHGGHGLAQRHPVCRWTLLVAVEPA